MIHIRKFNELNHSTYYKTAKNLEKDHPARAKKMMDWSNIVKNKEEMKEWEYNIEKYSPFGTFSVQLTNKDTDTLLIDDYYLQLEYSDNIYTEPNENCFLRFDVSIIPVDMESFDKLSRIEHEDYGQGFIRHIGSLYFVVKLKKYTYESIHIEYDNSENISASGFFTDRKSAVRFKRLLVDILTNKNYPVPDYDEKKYSSLYEKINLSFSESGISSDFGITLQDLEEEVKSVPVNKWYKSE